MRYLLDTNLLVWMSGPVERLSPKARQLIEDNRSSLMFSSISIYEVTIKAGLGRSDFRVDPVKFRNRLLENDVEELTFTSDHALAVLRLPLHHRDPFDRALVGQAISEDLSLMTVDKRIVAYPGPIMLV